MESRRLTAELGVPGGVVRVETDVPMGRVPMEGLLPALQVTADALVSHAAAQSAAAGKPISCVAGCGACCRQLVPIAPAEARQLTALVEGLPEPRRSVVRERFTEALRSVAEAGLLPALERGGESPTVTTEEAGLAYMALGIACPFLEVENCSIYQDRPIACREYLVTSSPAHCARPTRETIESVHLPTRVWAAVAWEEAEGGDFAKTEWVPLILSLLWAAKNPRGRAPRPGPELL
ncbi:MAG TPA: YkgJ family cysteine cluster protein, partial [Thermoanaerobaculia bacterium]|nr:YkgJ family cysteine cluster protein [Thermoanaerobaculia bacterium]